MLLRMLLVPILITSNSKKIYGAANENETRYSPAKCIGADMKVVSGDPDPKHVSTSDVER